MQHIFTGILLFIKNILYNILFQSLNATLTFIRVWMILKAILNSLMFLQLYAHSLLLIMLDNPLQLISILAYDAFIFSWIELFTFHVNILSVTKAIPQEKMIIAFSTGIHKLYNFTPNILLLDLSLCDFTKRCVKLLCVENTPWWAHRTALWFAIWKITGFLISRR